MGNAAFGLLLIWKRLNAGRADSLRAETRRFELLKAFTPYLVSSEAHSTGLCDVSKYRCEFTGNSLASETFLLHNRIPNHRLGSQGIL